ncbi:MFS transporter [Streptomyces sp. NPDC002463]|uniref:MFS transporter n=1 Tax=Streptomyces sp. NPDC002463 TaxID=3364645 RepID=UPI0036C5BFDD
MDEATRRSILLVNILTAFVFGLTTITSAVLSDRMGRRRVLIAGTVFGIAAGLLAFQIMQPGSAASFFAGVSILMIALGIPYGPAAAYLPELFKTRYRYTGTGMGYNLAGILGGGAPLLLAPPLAERYGGMGVAWYLSALGVISTLYLLRLKETRGVQIEIPEATAAEPA